MPSTRGPADLEAHLGYWLRRVSNHVSGTFAKALQAEQVSVAEWVALRLLHENPRMTPAQLAEAITMTRGAVSKIVDKLEGKAWVTRSEDAKDLRVKWLSLTRKGAHLVPRLAGLADHNDAHFFGCLEAAEQAELQRLLKKLAEAHQLRRIPVD